MNDKERHRFNLISVSLAFFVLLLLLSTPFILNGIFSGELDGPWIGFWGSFSGGILGTLGVIYVAYLQNRQQRELNKEQSEQQRELNEKMLEGQRKIHTEQINTEFERFEQNERNTRERMKIQIDLDIINSYLRDLEEIKDVVNEMQDIVEKYSLFKEQIVDVNKSKMEAKDDIGLKSYYDQAMNYINEAKVHINKYHPFHLHNYISPLIYKRLHIVSEEYKSFGPPDLDDVNNISDIINKMKMDNIRSENIFSDTESIRYSFKNLIEWIRIEIRNSHFNIKDISFKLTGK